MLCACCTSNLGVLLGLVPLFHCPVHLAKRRVSCCPAFRCVVTFTMAGPCSVLTVNLKCVLGCVLRLYNSIFIVVLRCAEPIFSSVMAYCIELCCVVAGAVVVTRCCDALYIPLK